MKKRTVWITGASRGIGAATARKFAENGDQVAVHCYQNELAAEALCKDISENGGSCLLVKGDVSKSTDIKRIHREIVDVFGGVDLLINNAGIAQQKLFNDISEAEWQRMFDIHVKGAFLCTQAVLPYMISEKKGKILNVSSIWGVSGASCEVHYSAAKAALIGMTKALAKELGPSNIQVNCIAPGVIETDMLADFDEDDRRVICEEIPLGRFGRAEEIAALALFLCSKDADYITGQVISSNGGQIT